MTLSMLVSSADLGSKARTLKNLDCVFESTQRKRSLALRTLVRTYENSGSGAVAGTGKTSLRTAPLETFLREAVKRNAG